MKKKIVVDVPVKIEGVSPAVKSNIGFLVVINEYLPLVSLPANIPGKIVVNIDGLVSINDSISVGDIDLPKDVELEPNFSRKAIICRVAPPQKELVEEDDTTDELPEVIGADDKEGEVPAGEGDEKQEQSQQN